MPFGGYLDIMCDMGFYAAVPLGFALARPDNALWAALLLASFVCTASSFLGRAVLAGQRGEPDDGARGRKSFFHAAASSKARRPSPLSCCSASFRKRFPGWPPALPSSASGPPWLESSRPKDNIFK